MRGRGIKIKNIYNAYNIKSSPDRIKVYRGGRQYQSWGGGSQVATLGSAPPLSHPVLLGLFLNICLLTRMHKIPECGMHQY